MDIAFSHKVNYFFGNNGMGKTNLLDAIYYLSFCKSHVNIPDSQLIHSDEAVCTLEGDYEYDNRTETVACAIRPRQRKQFKRNDKEYDRLSEHIGAFPLVMVSPADAQMIQGGSDERRRFLDLIIAQQDSRYLHALIQYNKALFQHNSLLRNEATDDALYEALENQLSQYGQIIYEQRRQAVSDFIPIFNDYYQTICRSAEKVDLAYLSQLDNHSLPALLAANRQRDLLLGYTSCGIHKDDLEMKLNNALIRRTGSQGQNKSYLIALKLAQFVSLCRKGHTTPILLLDDIFDKLDAQRVEEIVRLVGGNTFGQIFITDTNRNYLDRLLAAAHHDHALFKVEQGNIQTL